MADINLGELEYFLRQDIPYIPEKVKTFFDIGGFASRETIISNFYAYYLNDNESHGFKNLFLSSLLLLIKKEKINQQKIFNIPDISLFNSYNISREELTKNGKFIDIFIENYSNYSADDNYTLIIENKLFYRGDNPWEDYIGHSRSKGGNTIGVILSLDHDDRADCHPKFVNIKHNQLLEGVEGKLGGFVLSTGAEHIIILKQFIQNIRTMSTEQMSDDACNFLIENKERIKNIMDLYRKGVEYTFREIESACDKLNMNLKLGAQNREKYRYYISITEKVYFTIGIYDVNKFFIIIELNKIGYKYLVEKEIPVSESIDKIKIFPINENTNKSYHQYAILEGELTSEDFKNISDFICLTIEDSGLKTIFEKIEKLF